MINTGTVKCWGYNYYGQLGDGTNGDKLTAVDVTGLTGVTAITGGFSSNSHTCALINSGGVKCWGNNSHGEVGDGTTEHKLTPVNVSGLTNVTAIKAGFSHSCAIVGGGGVKCWGRNISGQLGDNTIIDRLTPVDVLVLAPIVTTVTSSTANGVHNIDDTIDITIQFDEAVTGTPQLTLETGTTDAVVNYRDTLTFTYIVASGHNSSDLDYVGTTSLSLNSGTILNVTADEAVLTLPTPGTAGSLGANKALMVGAPVITNITATATNGTYNIDDTIDITIQFTTVVNVTGTPQLTLETGATDAVVNYSSGSGSDTLTLTYTIASGNNSTDLNYASTTALSLNSGTIQDDNTNNAVLTLLTPCTTNSLGANKALVIDGVPPTVIDISATSNNGTYIPDGIINIAIQFDDVVTVTGTPQLTLETGTTDKVVNYSSGSGINTLTFTYTVTLGNNSSDLDYLNDTALALNGGTIQDVNTNDAVLTLPFPGTANSLRANKALVIDGIPPAVINVT